MSQIPAIERMIGCGPQAGRPSAARSTARRWSSLGGANRLDVFGLGTDDGMYHKAWNGSNWSPSWESLGGTFLNL
jgi:hypothetical protein